MNDARLREAIRNGVADPFAASVLWKSSPSPPPAPDYAGAATATAAGNRENTITAQRGSMVNQNTPYGSLNYNQTGTYDNGDPSYTANYDLSPTGQQILSQQNALSTGLFNSQNKSLNQVNGQGPMSLGGVQDVANKAYSNYTARLDPQWEQSSKALDAKLANQGITQGSEAYNNAQRNFSNAKNDAYTQANTAAIGTMPQTYQLEAAQYDQPLNRLNALRTGSQVQNPQFSSQPGQQYTPGPDLLGAANAQAGYNQGMYNSKTAQANSFNNGLFSLGSAALPMFF